MTKQRVSQRRSRQIPAAIATFALMGFIALAQVAFPQVAVGQQPVEEENPIVKLLDEVQDNMKAIEELLNQRDTGSGTQDAAQKTLQTMDKLIEEIEKASSQSSSSSSSQQSSKNQKQQQSKDQKQSRQQQQMQRQSPDQKQQQQQQDPKDNQDVPNNKTSEGKMPPNEAGDLESRRGAGVWGRLQKRDVEQVFDNGRKSMPEKYRILLEEYYGRRAPKGKKSQ